MLSSIVSASNAMRLIGHGCQGFLALVKDTQMVVGEIVNVLVVRDFLNAFLEELLVYLRSRDKHKQHLKIVFQIMRKHVLCAKFSKSEFWFDSASFIGHIVYKNGVMVDPKKIEVVKKWLRLTSITKIRSLLRITRYYRRFVKDFSKIITPITRLTQKGVKFIWIDACEESFGKLKTCLTTSLVLSLPCRSGGYTIYYYAHE
ncbi:Uncharacterized protein TCM_043731 [Theobroma cacao]|uniref:Reverse transcriptase/retrotransposon-derived protein RNase H-like domain-containing protein n=1 Tax=Theobroma cacao TaxID=3641 RepID=A0A061FPR4_THECC|nr:Uncharacterized protein TCM_043731 [Theobroma cacao]